MLIEYYSGLIRWVYTLIECYGGFTMLVNVMVGLYAD